MLKFKSNEAKEAYNLLIAGGSDEPLDTYCERHHIIPRSMGGTDDAWNLVYLTAGEHLLAHYWLWVGTGDRDLGYAYFAMANTNWSKYDETPEVTDAMVEAYESARIAFSKRQAGRPISDNCRKAVSKANAQRKWKDSSRKKMSASRKGKRPHDMTEETRAKIRKTLTGRKWSDSPRATRRSYVGDKNPSARSVINTETGQVWTTLVECAKDCGLKTASAIIRRIKSENWPFEYA